MDAEIKAQWVAALRSGDYEQGRHSLRVGNTFCCLGVLCDIVDGGAWIEQVTDSTKRFAWGEYGDNVLLPASVALAVDLFYVTDYGLTVITADPYFNLSKLEGVGSPAFQALVAKHIANDERYGTFSSINDEGATFEDIAAVIEAVL